MFAGFKRVTLKLGKSASFKAPVPAVWMAIHLLVFIKTTRGLVMSSLKQLIWESHASYIEYVPSGLVGGVKLFSFGKKFNSHAKIFLLFSPPTWPPRTYSIAVSCYWTFLY